MKWHKVEPRSKELDKKLSAHDPKKVVVKYDNGEIKMYMDKAPFALITEVFFLP